MCGNPSDHPDHIGSASYEPPEGFELPPGWEEKEGEALAAALEPERFVPRELRLKADIYEERNKLYGDNYKLFGQVIYAMFPEGVHLETDEDHNRWGVFVQIVAKVTRYAANFHRGGHDDSLDDMAVYSMMLKELDNEARRK